MIDLNKALFFDIETHRVKNWDEITPALQKAFINHYYDPQSYSSPEDHYSEVAGLHAEFSHVICVVFGFRHPATNEFVTDAFYGIDEVEILNKCTKTFESFQKMGYYLIGHNIQACDIPYLVKRYIINEMTVPDYINQYGQKPWEKTHVDTMDFWKFGDYKRVSLEMICACLGVDCKTDELGGDNLYEYDIKDMDWKQLVHYCTEDVVSNYRFMEKCLQYYSTID